MSSLLVYRQVNLRSKATVNGVTLSLASGKTTVNPGESFDVVINLNNTTTNKITAASVFLTYPSDKLTLTSITPGAFFLASYNSATTEMLNKTDITTVGVGKLLIGVPCTISSPWVCYPQTTAAGQVATFRFQVKTTAAVGNVTIGFDDTNTAISALDSAGNAIPTSILSGKTPVVITIKSPEITPATLTFSFKLLQNNNTVARTADVLLKSSSQTLSFTNIALTGNNGVFSPSTPITLTGITAGTTYDVLVKVPGYLRKKIGTTGTTTWNNILPLAGDFDGNNILNILDIGNILGLYNAISVSVTAVTRVYDLDGNGVINILDVANTIASYTAISVLGDN